MDGYDLSYIYSVCAKNVDQCNEACRMMQPYNYAYGGVGTGWFDVAIFIYLLELWALKIN
jgi:hypothetical protein